MKIGIIGCGTIAKEHAGIVKKLFPDALLTFCDINKIYAEKMAAKYNGKSFYDNIDELLEKEMPDTIHVLTPVSGHAGIAEKALNAGCHVYIEKPVTETIAEYSRITDLAKAKGKKVCAGYSALGMPVVLRAKEVIDSGKFGRLIAVHCSFGNSWPGNTIPYGNPNHWAYLMTGGVLQNMADHPTSLILDALERVDDFKIFYSRRNLLPNDCPDLLHVAVRNQNQIGSLTLSLGHGSADKRIHYILEGGSIIVDLARQLYCATEGKGPHNFIKKTLSGITEGFSLSGGTINNIFSVATGKLKKNPGLVNVVTNYYRAVNSNQELLVKERTVINTITLLENVWKEIGNKYNNKE